MREYLKVKVASLAAEIRIIKTQEQRTLEKLRKRRAIVKEGNTKYGGEGLDLMAEHNKRDEAAFWGLRRHRYGFGRDGLRREARLSHLAYGFIRGRSYLQMEDGVYRNNKLTDADWAKIEAMVQKYAEGDKRDVAQRFAAFKAEWSIAPFLDEDVRAARRQQRIAAYAGRPKRTRDEWENSKTATGA